MKNSIVIHDIYCHEGFVANIGVNFSITHFLERSRYFPVNIIVSFESSKMSRGTPA